MEKKALIVISVLLVICILEGAVILLTPQMATNVSPISDLNLSAEELAKSINYSTTEIVCPDDLNRPCTFEIQTVDLNLRKNITQFSQDCEFFPKEPYLDINRRENGSVAGYTDLNGIYHIYMPIDFTSVCEKVPKTLEEKNVEKEKLIKAFVDAEVRKLQYCLNK